MQVITSDNREVAFQLATEREQIRTDEGANTSLID